MTVPELRNIIGQILKAHEIHPRAFERYAKVPRGTVKRFIGGQRIWAEHAFAMQDLCVAIHSGKVAIKKTPKSEAANEHVD